MWHFCPEQHEIDRLRAENEQLCQQQTRVPEAIVDEIVDEYEWREEDEHGREACYTPSAQERLMLKDFAMWLLSEGPHRAIRESEGGE